MSNSMRKNLDLIEQALGSTNREVYKQGVAIDHHDNYVGDIDVHQLDNGMKEYYLSVYPFNENKRLDSISLMRIHKTDEVDVDKLIDKAKSQFQRWVKDNG